MIHQRFIDEAIRIRKEYISTIKLIQYQEYSILSYKSDIDKIMNDGSILIKDVKNNKIDEEKTKSILNQKLIGIEENIIKIQNKLKPYNDKIEDLRIQSKNLFNSISEKYKNLKDKDIQLYIYNKLKDASLI